MSLEPPLKHETPTKKHRISAPIPPSAEVVDLDSFCFTPITQKGTTKSTAILVEQYSHDDRDLHLAIAASLGLSNPSSIIDLSDTEDDDEVRILNFNPVNTPFRKRTRISTPTNTIKEKGESSRISTPTNISKEKGESSSSTPFVCEICTETKTTEDSFCISGCSHSYCIECVVMYVGSKLHENVINIRCPVSNCKGLLEPEDCREILPKEVFDRWGFALCEAVVLATEKFYCPFKDCSALLIDDGEEVIRESECPNCRRMFCAQCKVPWHEGIDCEEFKKLNKDEREQEDIMLMQLAKSKMWRRCPKCRFYVEKSAGCMYMRCRCGFAFCYNCGAVNMGGSHFCSNCRR